MRDWTIRDDKARAIRDVLRHFLAQSDSEYAQMSRQCLEENNEYGRKLFAEIGQIEILENARVAFLATGEGRLKEKGSLLIEAPPEIAVTMSGSELIENYVRSDIGKPTPCKIARECGKMLMIELPQS